VRSLENDNMTPCKRIEIVIDQPHASRLVQRLEELHAPGYTLIPRASGSGDRGERRGDDPTGTETNCVFIIACEDDALAQRIVDGLRPLLTRIGGLCLVSEALSLAH
jgi:hypothetical protein